MSTTATRPEVTVTSGVDEKRHEWFDASLDENNGVSAELIRSKNGTSAEVMFFGENFVPVKQFQFSPRDTAHLVAVLERLRDRVAELDAMGEI